MNVNKIAIMYGIIAVYRDRMVRSYPMTTRRKETLARLTYNPNLKVIVKFAGEDYQMTEIRRIGG